MAKSGMREPPKPARRTASPKPSPAIAPPKIKPNPATPKPVAEMQPRTKPFLAKRAAMAPSRKPVVDPGCNHSEPVPALLQVTVGRNLRAARLAAGLTLRQVAELSGILFQYVYKIENGEKNLTLSTIDNLAKVLQVDASDLLRNKPS